METNQTPDFGEPWREQTVSFMPGTIEDRDGKVVNTREQKLRAIDCVAACAGMADPAKDIQAMRDAIKAAAIALFRHNVEDVDLAEFEELTMTVTAEDQQSLRAALAKLQPHLPAKP